MIDPNNYDPIREESMQLDVIKRLDMILNGGTLPPDYKPIRAGNYNLDILWRLDQIIENGGGGGGGGNYQPTITTIATGNKTLTLSQRYDIIYVQILNSNGGIFGFDFDAKFFDKIGITNVILVATNTDVGINVSIPQNFVGDTSDILMPALPSPTTKNNFIEYSFLTIATDGMGNHTTLLLSTKYF